MSVFHALQDFLREFRAINDHAVTGRPPRKRGNVERLPSYNVDGWLNAGFDIAHRVRRP